MSTDTLAILIVLTLLSLFIATITITGVLLISRDTTRISQVASSVSYIEELLVELMTEAKSGAPEQQWRTADGKYEAGSFEELLSKMSSDPNGPLSADEIEAIKSVFQKIMGDKPDDDVDSWNKK